MDFDYLDVYKGVIHKWRHGLGGEGVKDCPISRDVICGRTLEPILITENIPLKWNSHKVKLSWYITTLTEVTITYLSSTEFLNWWPAAQE